MKKLSRVCGILGIIGTIGVIVTHIIAIALVERHNPIGETISTLAIGKYAWVQDMGLDMFATGAIACGIGLYIRSAERSITLKIIILLLFLIGIDIILIAEHNQYANKGGTGEAIHMYCVYALGGLFVVASGLMALRVRNLNRKWYYYNLVTAIMFLVLAPFFFVVPTTWEGVYERTLASILVAWVIFVSWLLIRRPQVAI